ncbi:penicillin-insensitive murein endopeptidase [Gallibacterium melopsittaci]|uniref:Penicillin-insensitive murein endopeptidase n=1 Tax=Gallibacterium melopsittaci TaxID=516063 RepID=A0ABV6HWC6_9PAST
MLRKFVIAIVLLSCSSLTLAVTEWQKIKRPISGEPLPIGSYSNGCIIGAKALPLQGEGYQVIRSQKLRYFGHPEMLEYLVRLGKRVKAAGLPTMLVGDIAMPAGGRFATGHASHQMGLDADIWLKMGGMSSQQALNPTAILMVNRKLQRVDDRVWSNNQTKLIQLAATDPQVARIFVNPAIKLKLCQTVSGDRSWLRKIRPWFGHDAHFHVRLHCPKGAQYCEEQAPMPAGDGCGAELMSWFEPKQSSTPAPAKQPPVLPILCQQLLDSPEKQQWFAE